MWGGGGEERERGTEAARGCHGLGLGGCECLFPPKARHSKRTSRERVRRRGASISARGDAPKRRIPFRKPFGILEIFWVRVSRFPLPRAAQAAGCRHACGGGGARAGGKKSGVARVASKVAQVGWDRVPQACPQALLGPSRSENPRSGLGRGGEAAAARGRARQRRPAR